LLVELGQVLHVVLLVFFAKQIFLKGGGKV